MATGVSAAELVQLAAPLELASGWLPPDPRAIVGDCVIHDVGDPVPDRPGGVLLLVGARPGDPATGDAVSQAGQRRYACVVVKPRGGGLGDLVSTAESSDVALLVAADDTSWRDVDRLVGALVKARDSRAPAYAQVRAGDLFSLANAIAHSVGGATAIEDVNGLMYAHSNLPHQGIDEIRLQSITQRVTPTFAGDVDRYLQVRNAEHPQRFRTTEPGLLGRLGMPVRAGGELLGLLWVLDGNPPLAKGASQALEDAATVTALHLLQLRQQENSQRWHRAEALASLLSGRLGVGVASAILGLPAASSARVLAIATSAPEDESALGVARTIDLVNLYCEAWHPRAMATAVDATIFALLPSTADATGTRSLAAFARDVAGTVRRTNGFTLKIGIGPVAATLAEVPESRRLAELTLGALTGNGPEPVVATIEELRSRVLLRRLAELDVLDLGLEDDPLRRLLENDRERGTTYGESLLAYLDAFGDTTSAARALNIHENTLRYRIRRLQQLFPVDLDDPDVRLVTWLQLRLADL
jgi:hypothetical protein